ncbi:MAG TPA: hypothetical protein VF755_05575 [Catenuloplanes sp.]
MPQMRTAGWLAIASGIAFLGAVGYLFTVLTGAGLALEMFDDPAALLPWIGNHLAAYHGLYLLYAVSQLLLLPVPALLSRWRGNGVGWLSAAVWGTAAAVIAIVGLAVSYGMAGPSSAAYLGATDQSARWAVLVTHHVAADIAKDVRLFSEVLLGGWLALTGWLLTRSRGPRGWWLLAVAGGWTVLVAGWKLVDPLMPLEDWLAFVVATAQIALGVALLRTGRDDDRQDDDGQDDDGQLARGVIRAGGGPVPRPADGTRPANG